MSDLVTRIEAVLEPPTDQLLVRFFDAASPFAGTTFDDLSDNRRDRFTACDLLAVTLLDMRSRPRAVRAILHDQAESLNGRLAAISHDVPLWSATDANLAPAYDLWAALRGGGALSGVGPTMTSKLMARKRPTLIPIVDSVVRQALGFTGDSWKELRAALQENNLVERIEARRPQGVGPAVSTLRLLDVAVWMRHSQGKAAKADRESLGLTQ